MALGPSVANWANKALAVFRASTFTAPSTVYAQLHTGDPGASGTANTITPDPTRKTISFGTESAASIAASGTVSWTSWASGTETVTHVSLWDASSAGNFLWSVALGTSRTVNDGDTLQLTALTLSITGTAA